MDWEGRYSTAIQIVICQHHDTLLQRFVSDFGRIFQGQCLQDGWTRRGHPPAVLVEGDWALLTCTPDREGPTGGRDRLQLIKLDTLNRRNEKDVCMSISQKTVVPSVH